MRLAGVIRQARQHVGKPRLWVDVIELGGGDEAVDRSCTPAALIGAGEGPIPSPYGDSPQLAFGGIVRHAQAAVVKEACERIPAAEAVIDRLGSCRCSWRAWRAARGTTLPIHGLTSD